MTDFVQLPPDGVGKKILTKTINIGGVDYQVQVVFVGDPTTNDTFQRIDNHGSSYVRYAEGEPLLASFGATKTANSHVIGVYENSTNDMPDLFTVTTENGGTNPYASAQSCSELITTTANGSKVVKTTNKYHYYYPSQGQVIIMTVGLSDSGVVGNTRRWGYYDDNDGIYFELFDNTLNVVIRNSITSTEIRIPRNSWNGDIVDGTGLSELAIDLTKTNIFWIDFQWLGSGRVRFGVFSPTGERITCHTVHNANTNTYAYMKTGTLPIRFENVNRALTGAGSTLRYTCAAIQTEGSTDFTFWRSAYASSLKTIGSSDTPVLSVRSKQTFEGQHNGVNIYPTELSCYVTGGAVQLKMWWPITLTGSSWLLDNGTSLEADDAATAIDLDGSEYIFKTVLLTPGVTSIDLTKDFELNDEGILCNSDGVQIPFVFTAKKINPADTVNSMISINYRELR
ncbi:MAG: hypothetical protein ACXW2E_00125 [Nitrososphaeraceae archaeon]